MSKLGILIIDDNKDLADGLGLLLEGEGYQTSIAYNGGDGIKAFNSGDFDIVFIDIKLPDMSGIEVSLKIHKEDPAVRTAMMTGYRVEQLLNEVVEDADIEIVRNPFDMEQVLEILNQIKSESIILVAGDGVDLPDSLSKYLTDHGLKTVLARNGQEAVDSLQSSPVDVLLLDMHMPIMRGLEVYLELKQSRCAVTTVLIMGYAEEEAKAVDILQSTMTTGCLFKPFKPEDMLHTIEQTRSAGTV